MDAKEKIAVVGIVAALVTGWKAELKPFIATSWSWFVDGPTPWRFGFALSIGYLLWWWIDRSTLKRQHWIKEAKDAMGVVIAEHRRLLATDRAEWARQLREIVEDAVQYKANLATVQAEAKARIEADAEIIQRLEAIEHRLPPMPTALS
jgi:hypothetical protein